MSKKAGIIVSLILAIVFTLGVTMAGNAKYRQVARTVDVVKAVTFIPAGQEIKQSDVAVVKVPESIAGGLVTDPQEAIGKAAKVSLLKDQFIMKDAVGGNAAQEGMVEVFIPVDMASSAAVMAGETVSIYQIDKNNTSGGTAKLMYEKARVLDSLDQNGGQITPGQSDALSPVTANKVPVSVGIEVPKDIAPQIVQAAANKAIYLVKN